jgi:energy-coupling factor transport system substrate-specific component
MKPSAKLALSEIALFGILGGLTFAAKMVMAALPNIEPVSLMVMLFAVVFGKKALYPIYVYVTLEILYYGINTWSICYLYIWLILALGAWLMKHSKEPLAWAMLSGVYGLLFGALCGIVDVFIGGFAYAVTKWTSGILFDIYHCVGNFVIALFLFCPLRNLMQKLYARMRK